MNTTILRSLLTIAFAAFGLQTSCDALASDRYDRDRKDSSTATLPVQDREINRILSWLPEDTETLVISRGRVPVGRSRRLGRVATTASEPGPLVESDIPDPFGDPPFRYEDLVAAACINPLVGSSALYPSDSWTSLVREFYGPQNTIVFAKVMRPAADGTTEACDIVVFTDGTPARLLRAFQRFRNATGEIDGIRVLKVELNDLAPDHKGTLPPNRRVLASPLSNVYLAATTEPLLQTLLQRMKQRSQRSAFPARLAEWRHVELAAPAWGIRHYQNAIAQKHGTSMVKWDPDARGLVFFCGVEPAPFVTLRYLSTSADAGKRFVRMRSRWLGVSPEEEDSIPPLPRISPECVEDRRRINVTEQEAKHSAIAMSVEQTPFSVGIYLALLGFGPQD